MMIVKVELNNIRFFFRLYLFFLLHKKACFFVRIFIQVDNGYSQNFFVKRKSFLLKIALIDHTQSL